MAIHSWRPIRLPESSYSLPSAAGYLARRPGEQAWIWAATGLAIFAIVSEPTVRLLLTKATPVAVQLPDFPEVPRTPFNPTFVALAPLAVAAVGALLALLGLLAGATSSSWSLASCRR